MRSLGELATGQFIFGVDETSLSGCGTDSGVDVRGIQREEIFDVVILRICDFIFLDNIVSDGIRSYCEAERTGNRIDRILLLPWDERYRFVESDIRVQTRLRRII